MTHNNTDILIIGGGISGLSVAYHLHLPYALVEQNEEIGGICRSTVIGGCTFDYGPRILLPGSQYTAEVSQQLLGDNLHYLAFQDWIYHHQYNVYTKYPIQKYLYGLPATEILRCLTGLVETAMQLEQQESRHFANYRDWLYAKVGGPMAEMVVLPQEAKKWRTPLEAMDYRSGSGKVAHPNLEISLRGATHDRPHERQFGYPLRGGIAALLQAMASHLTNVKTGVALQAVDTEQHIAYFSDDSRMSYRALVATSPLPELVGMLEQVPADIAEAAQALQHISLLCICLVINRENISDKNFVYVYDPALIFHRLSFMSNLSPHMAPPGYTALIAEVSFFADPPLDDDALVQRVLKDLHTMHVLQPQDTIADIRILRLPYAYPRMHIGWLETVQQIRAYLKEQDIYTLGRFGEWEYLNIHDIIPRSYNLAEQLHKQYG